MSDGITRYSLTVLPPEHRTVKDPVTGAEVLFATTGPSRDLALYFHQEAWLSDESVLLFQTFRPEYALMGYLFATGELVRVATAAGAPLTRVTAARSGNRIFGAHDDQALEITLEIEHSPDPARVPSAVTAAQRVVGTLSEGMAFHTLLQENADGTLLGAGVDKRQTGRRGIVVMEVGSGAVREIGDIDYASAHVLFSHTDPCLISFNGKPNRLWLVDVRDGRPRRLYDEAEGEYATHESWWVDDYLLFIGGFRDKEGAVKVIDIRTGVVRVIGPGAWVPWIGDGEHVINRWNWWEATGSDDGRWVVADNWYGDIVLFDARTTQMRRLTLGHRNYKQQVEEQPTAAWDRGGKRVAFTSQWLGAASVCVATVPGTWPPDPAEESLAVAAGVTRAPGPPIAGLTAAG